MGSTRSMFLAPLLLALVWSAGAVAQELTLTKDSEDGFRRFIHMTQNGKLGDDVRNANVALSGAQARLELVRKDAPGKVLLLTPKRSTQTSSRHFDIAPGEHATAQDVMLVGKALDECFGEDPFQFAGLEESLADGRIPGIGEAWINAGWRGVLRVAERRMMALASLEYTVVVIIGLVFGFLVSLVVLWGGSANIERRSVDPK